MPKNLESQIFNLLKKYYTIGAYFPYSFIKAQFPNENFGDMLKAFNYLKKNKIIENISNRNYKFIKNEFNFLNSEYIDTIDIKKKEEKLPIINIQHEIIEYIHSYYAVFDKYPLQKSIVDEIHDTIDIMFKNKIIKRVNFSIVPVVNNNFPDNIIEKKIIKYLHSYYNTYKKYPTRDHIIEAIHYVINMMIQDNILKMDNSFIVPVDNQKKQIEEKENQFKKLILSSEQDKKSTNEIDINTEIRKLYGYITKQNKRLESSIKEINHIQQNIIKECAKSYDEIEKLKKEINNIIKKF